MWIHNSEGKGLLGSLTSPPIPAARCAHSCPGPQEACEPAFPNSANHARGDKHGGGSWVLFTRSSPRSFLLRFSVTVHWCIGMRICGKGLPHIAKRARIAVRSCAHTGNPLQTNASASHTQCMRHSSNGCSLKHTCSPKHGNVGPIGCAPGTHTTVPTNGHRNGVGYSVATTHLGAPAHAFPVHPTAGPANTHTHTE